MFYPCVSGILLARVRWQHFFAVKLEIRETTQATCVMAGHCNGHSQKFSMAMVFLLKGAVLVRFQFGSNSGIPGQISCAIIYDCLRLLGG